MNFNRKGWLQKYTAFREALPFDNELPSAGVKVLEETGLHHELDEAIYYFLQPTGLLYGFPMGLPFPTIDYPGARFMDPRERVHLIFLESLFACLVADRHYLLSGLSDERDHFQPALKCAVEYFTHASQSRAARPWALLRWPQSLRRQDHGQRFEQEIRRRLGQGTETFRLPGIYYNSFLFLDLHSCMMWQRRMLVEPEREAEHLQQLSQQQLQQRQLLIRLMIAAATSSGEVVPAERRLIQWFLKSSGLSRKRVAVLRRELKRGITLEEIHIQPAPWLVRRFMLEATLMTILVDRDLSAEEERFVMEVVEKLELWEEELNQSMVALEVFILNQEDSLPAFKDRPLIFHLSENLRRQATTAIRKNLHRVVTEIRETKTLYNLLIKSTHTSLTPEEKSKVRQQLIDVLKTIPALAIFALPGGGIILPVLIKLLPFNLLPSAFED